MTIEQKIFSKLEPHAKRIREGDGNDFDYLPAVLLQLMEEQKRHAKLMDDTASLLEALKSTGDTIGLQSKAQITAFESAVQKRLEKVETAINNEQTQFQNIQSAMSGQIAVIASAHATHAKQVNESQSAISLQIESFSSNIQRSHVAMSGQIAMIASAHATHAKQVNESQSAISLQIESFSSNIQRSHVNFMRLLIAGLVASTATIGLAVAILQRH